MVARQREAVAVSYIKKSSVYDCTVEDVEYHNVSIVTHSHHLVVAITLP